MEVWKALEDDYRWIVKDYVRRRPTSKQPKSAWVSAQRARGAGGRR